MKAKERNRIINPSLFFVSISFIALVLFPKSIPMLRLGVSEFAWGVGDVILIVVFILYFGNIILTKKIEFQYGTNSLDKIILSYFIIIAYAVVIGIIRFPEKTIFIIGSYVKYFEVLMVYFLIRKSLYIEKQADYLIKIFTIVSLGVLAISIIQRISPPIYLMFWEKIGFKDVMFQENLIAGIGWRLSGPFFNPNALAEFLIIAIPIGFVGSFLQRNFIFRLIYFGMTVVSIIILVLTQSREGYLGFLFTLLLFIYYSISSSKRYRKNIRKSFQYSIFILIIIGVIFFCFRVLLYQRFIGQTFQGSTGLGTSAYERLTAWETGVDAIGRYWLIGVGFAESSTALNEINNLVFGTHNTFFRVWIEGGIIVFAIFLFLLSRIWNWRKTSLTEPWNYYKYALISGLIGLLITGFFGDTFQDTEIMLSFMFLLAILNSVYQIQRENNLENSVKSNSIYHSSSTLR